MRCPNENKFVSYDEPEVEINASEINEGLLTAEVRIVLKCAECGEELKETELQFEQQIEHQCGTPDPDDAQDPRDSDYEIVSEDGSGYSRTQNKDRHGKPITKARYMKTFYGATLTFSVKCNDCDEEFTVEGKVEEQASAFNELV